jgi:signal transduction histidine kinase
MTPVSAPVIEDAAVLWLAILQRSLGRASHDVRDALNGVSVNVDVIRSRAARPGTSGADVAPFAEAAGQQLERLTTLIEAVLALGRSERGATDVSFVLRQMVTICGAASSSADASVEIRPTGSEAVDGMTTRLSGDIVRLTIGATLLDAATGTDRNSRAPAVICTIGGNATHVLVTVEADGRRVKLPDSAAEAARASGVQWTEGPQHLSLAFPRL